MEIFALEGLVAVQSNAIILRSGGRGGFLRPGFELEDTLRWVIPWHDYTRLMAMSSGTFLERYN